MLLGDHGADRHAGAEPLRRSDDVWLNAEVLNRPHLAGATNARLHFVNNDGDAVLVGDLLQAREEVLIRNHVAALTLNRLHNERGDLVARDRSRNDALLKFVETLTAERHVKKAWGERPKVGVILRLGVGERQRAERAPVEAANESNDPLTTRHVARQLNRGFNRLGARVLQ